jgi:hypothetical protein
MNKAGKKMEKECPWCLWKQMGVVVRDRAVFLVCLHKKPITGKLCGYKAWIPKSKLKPDDLFLFYKERVRTNTRKIKKELERIVVSQKKVRPKSYL